MKLCLEYNLPNHQEYDYCETQRHYRNTASDLTDNVQSETEMVLLDAFTWQILNET